MALESAFPPSACCPEPIFRFLFLDTSRNTKKPPTNKYKQKMKKVNPVHTMAVGSMPALYPTREIPRKILRNVLPCTLSMSMKFTLSGSEDRAAKSTYAGDSAEAPLESESPPNRRPEMVDHKPLFMTLTPKSNDLWAKMEVVDDVRYCVGVPPVACTYQRKIFCMKLVSMSPMDQAKFSDHDAAMGGIFSTWSIEMMITLWKYVNIVSDIADILDAEAELPKSERTLEISKPAPATTAVAHLAPTCETVRPFEKELWRQPTGSFFEFTTMIRATASRSGNVNAALGIFLMYFSSIYSTDSTSMEPVNIGQNCFQPIEQKLSSSSITLIPNAYTSTYA